MRNVDDTFVLLSGVEKGAPVKIARWVHDGCRRERKREKDFGVSHWFKVEEHE